MSDRNARFPPPTFQDWLLLVLNVVFVAAGLLILPSSPDAGIVTLAFFGTCLFVSAGTVLRKFRFRRHAAAKVDVQGGVPIRPRMGAMLALGGWLTVLGIILVVFGHSYPLLFRILGAGVAIAGGVLTFGVLVGWWPGGFLQFDPHHLTIAQRAWRVRLPWDEIVDVVEAELQSNPVLLIAVADADRLAVDPPQAVGRAMKAIANSRALIGADFMIMTTHYGIDLPVLSDAIARYVNDVSARAELRHRYVSK
jgi:hypothetical protein